MYHPPESLRMKDQSINLKSTNLKSNQTSDMAKSDISRRVPRCIDNAKHASCYQFLVYGF